MFCSASIFRIRGAYQLELRDLKLYRRLFGNILKKLPSRLVSALKFGGSRKRIGPTSPPNKDSLVFQQIQISCALWRICSTVGFAMFDFLRRPNTAPLRRIGSRLRKLCGAVAEYDLLINPEGFCWFRCR